MSKKISFVLEFIKHGSRAYGCYMIIETITVHSAERPDDIRLAAKAAESLADYNNADEVEIWRRSGTLEQLVATFEGGKLKFKDGSNGFETREVPRR